MDPGKTTVFSKIEHWFKSVATDINDRYHANEEYYKFPYEVDESAEVES
ncbi:hypothetical protein [Orientia tsutsugamushi]|nr:hypothetical protein [Orientia tsutsugamushi]